MNRQSRFSARPTLGLRIPRQPIGTMIKSNDQCTGGNEVVVEGTLSPNLQPTTPPALLPQCSAGPVVTTPSRVGDYILLETIDASSVIHICKAINMNNQEECICKVK